MWKRWRIRIMLFLAVLGPGFITANVDNDSGGILTYSQAGAQYGYTLLWTMIPITLALIVVQEMCARMGVVTGKGLSDLIREEFGLRVTVVMMLLLVVVNYTNVITEFIGIAGSLHLFHVSRFVSVPICAVLVWFLAVRGDYKQVEKIFLIASVVYIAYIFAGVLSQPSWHDALLATVQMPRRTAWTSDYVYMAIASSEPPSRRGCSSTCNPRLWKRAFALRVYAASTPRRGRRQLLHGYRCLVHCRGLRRHALCAWHGSDPGAVGRGRRHASTGR